MLSFFSVGLFAEDSGKSGNQQQARIQRLEYAIRSEAAEQLIAEMRAYAKSQGGYMSSLQYGRLELRIPDTIGRAAIEQKLASVAGTHIYRNERSENDVSEELADLKARLAVAEKNLGRLRALSGAAELDDLLDLEQALSRSLNEVNQYKGQIRYLQESSQLTQVLLQINQMGGTSSATIVPIGWIRGLTLPAIVGGSK
ncbi:MAG: DUF4349 domain-containing protein [Leptospiraceae bacterium]|nr:DUF4349 domain-containing protein [Leptospiraceae bacterium]